MENVQIKVNTFNRLKKIRSGVVYESITTVIDELLQNCQRAFVTHETEQPTIDTVVQEDILIIRDNGGGCENPQDIFEFEKSGWDISDAFGQGGSESVFQISDFITIRSRNWKVSVDVENVLDSGNLDLEVIQTDDYFDGYEIELRGQKIYQNAALLKDYIKSHLAYYPYTCYINGNVIERKDLQEFKSEFSEKFDNPFYTATLGVDNSFKDCEVYYEKRKVCDKWKSGVYGIIELKRDAVDLKAPDRKSIIYNDKKLKFDRTFEDDVKLLYIEFISQCSPDQFDKYASYIDTILSPKDYADYLPDIEFDYVKQQQRLEQEVPTSGTVNDIIAAQRQYPYSTSRGGSSGGVTHVNSEYSTMGSKKFRDNLGKIFNKVWCEYDRREEYGELIKCAEEYGIEVVYAKNILYEKALDYWKIPHIAVAIGKSPVRYTVSGSSGFYRYNNTKEERLMNVLHKIEEHYGLGNIFKIADIESHLKITNKDEVILDATRKVNSAALSEQRIIYLDRKSLNLDKINVTYSKAQVTKFDILVVLLNINTIASGLAKILYNTVDRTVEHYNKVDKISKEIAMLLASL